MTLLSGPHVSCGGGGWWGGTQIANALAVSFCGGAFVKRLCISEEGKKRQSRKGTVEKEEKARAIHTIRGNCFLTGSGRRIVLGMRSNVEYFP